MPHLPLILACVLVFVLLRLDRKQYPEATGSLWIPTIWMLLIASKGGLAVWFGGGGDEGAGAVDEGNSVDRLFISMLLVVGLLILFRRRFNWASGIRDNAWIMVVVVFTLLTVLWSDMQFASFKRWVRWTITTVVMGFVVRTEVDPRQALLSVFRRSVYVLLPVSVIVVRYYERLGRQYVPWSGELAWIGASTNKNGLAQLCIFAMFLLIWAFTRRWRGIEKPVAWYQKYFEVFVFLMALYVFMGPQHSLTTSSTSLACLVIGVATLLGLIWMEKRHIRLNAILVSVLVGFIIYFGAITPFIGHLPFFDISTVLKRDSTLTGRADLWARLVPYAQEQFLLGYGIGGFWSDLRMEQMQSTEAHNGYLDLTLNYGIVGLILFTLLLISSSLKARWEMAMSADPDWGMMWFCMILMTLLYNITESSLAPFTGMFRVALLVQICCQTGRQSNDSLIGTARSHAEVPS